MIFTLNQLKDSFNYTQILKGTGLGMSNSIGHINTDLLGDDILFGKITSTGFSTSDIDLQNKILNLIYYMIKYRSTLMIFERTSQIKPVALIASPTGILDAATVGAANDPYAHSTNPMSWYASTEYNNLRDASRDDFLPVGLDLPFYSLMGANTDRTNINSFEYWFSAWVSLNFGVVFQKIQL